MQPKDERGEENSMSVSREWIAREAEQKERLYARHGKPLESAHKGEYVAISRDGRTIVGKRMGEVLHKAEEDFGGGEFSMARIGYPALARWLAIPE